MHGAGLLQPQLWAATCQSILGLLWSTGLRVGEVLGLQRCDVSFAEQRLTVWRTKFGKSRHVPLSASTLEALTTYDEEHRQRCWPKLHGPTDSSWPSGVARCPTWHCEMSGSNCLSKPECPIGWQSSDRGC